jgi:SAM-dependent methyltransferase
VDVEAAVAPGPTFQFFLGGHNLMISMRRMSSASTPSGVWILDDGLIMGGGQRFGLRLAEAFADMGLPTRFLSPADAEVSREARRLGFEVVDISYPRLVPPALTRMPDTVIRLREQFQNAAPGTMVIGNTARCQAYATAALVTVRQWPVLVHLMHEQNSAARPSARAVYRRIGALVAVGDSTADLYRQRLPGVEIDAVSNFLGEAEVRRVMAARTPAPGGARPVIGLLARMIPAKGVLELIDELALSPDAWECLRVGAPEQDHDYGQRVRARIAALGLQDRVQLLGEVGDLDAFFASIDVLVVPSTGEEAQPTVILESLLHGRPVILREPLRAAQLEGLPVAYYTSPEELRDNLRSLPVGVTSAEDFMERFGASDVVDTILRVAADELGEGPRGYFDWHDEPGYYRDIIDHFSPRDRLLDVGCGTAWIQDHFPNYVGIDLSAEAVEHARERGRNAMVHDVEQPLPFDDDSFDGVIVKDLLEHVLDPVSVVREIGRVLRPGGLVFASSPDAQRWVWDDYTHRRPYTLTGYRRLFRDQGFSVAKSGYESVMPGIGIISGLTPHNHRPKPLAALARMRLVRRNVWVLGRWT